MNEVDTQEILEKLLPHAKAKSFALGLMLNVPLHNVEAIHSNALDPSQRILEIIIVFVRQNYPAPTWRAIIKALRSTIINLPEVADELENSYSGVSLTACVY